MATKKLDVSLLIDHQVFKVNKNELCEHSDYFRAMFSGKYIEQDKQEITIDVVDANSMNIIMKYMETGLIDLSEYPLSTIGELAISVNFLQITELMKQIEYCLELQLTLTNWVDTMTIAENASYKKLAERSAAVGLYEFKFMKPEYIEPVQKLVWYLSHNYLNAECEIEVFKFGLDWILHKETGADALLLILGCLDMSRLTKEELIEIKNLIKDYVNSLAEKVIHCLCKLATDFEISEMGIKNNKPVLCETFTERVYTETLNLVIDSKKRELRFHPFVGLWSKEQDLDDELAVESNCLYMFNEEQGFAKWLEVAEKQLWGWNVVSWGPTKVVVVCGEHGRGIGLFWKSVKVYDILRKEWTDHGVNLPVRRHGGVVIIEDSLYIIGGVGGFRIVLDTGVIYDLKQRSWRKIAKFPEAIQSPALCVHNKQVYAAGHKTIYRYDGRGDEDRWITVIHTDIRPSCMESYNGYIYCTQNYFNNLYRFRPNVDNELEVITCFSSSPANLCHLGDRLLAFTSTNNTQDNMVTVEEYKDKDNDGKPRVLWVKKNCNYTINDVAKSWAVLDTLPPIQNETSQYLRRYLSSYEAYHSN